MKLVVSQPMYLPWAGLFDQIRLADHFVHYDDVQLPQGRSFITRVQLKANDEIDWLSVPLVRSSRALIADAKIDTTNNWFQQHRRAITQALGHAPYFSAVESILQAIEQQHSAQLAELNIFLTEHIAAHLGLRTKFSRASELKLTSKSSQRLLDICAHYGASTYITGHGARNYLDHALFTAHGINVEYMHYAITPYPQYGAFTPYVTILDLIAHTGPNALQHMQSTTVAWEDFRA